MEITGTELVNNPTRVNIAAYLDARAAHAERRGETPYPWGLEFCTDAHFEEIEKAREWWPRDVRDNLSFGYALIMGLNGYANPMPKLCEQNVMNGISRVAGQVCTWLLSEKRDPHNPNETASQRAQRLGREAQQRRRTRLGKQVDPEAKSSAECVQATYQAFLAVCAERDAVLLEWKGKVAAAQQAHRDLRDAHQVRFG